METKAASSGSLRGRIFFILSAISLGAAGILAALAILSGANSWKPVGTAMLIFTLNILMLVSFTAAHSWLRIGQRISSVIATFGAVVFLWVEVPYWSSYNNYGEAPPALVVLRDWSYASWWIVAAFSLSCLLSLTWRYLSGSTGLKLCYALSIGLGLASASILALEIGLGSADRYSSTIIPLPLMAGALAILSAAASLIVIIGALIERARSRNSAASVTHAGDVREEILALASSGELIEIILSNPAALGRLKSALDGSAAAQLAREEAQISQSENAG